MYQTPEVVWLTYTLEYWVGAIWPRIPFNPWLQIMTFSCWRCKVCGEMELLASRCPARLARCGTPSVQDPCARQTVVM